MEKKIGFIGCGNMGKSHSRRSDCQRSGASRANLGIHPPPRIKSPPCMTSSASTPQNRRKKWRKSPTSFFAAVKPGIMIKVLSEITSSLNKDSLVVSIAAGVTLDQLARALGHDRKNYPRHAEHSRAG